MPITKARLFWPLLGAVVAADWMTKRWAELALAPVGMIHPVIGDLLRFRLAYNRGAATGISLGEWSRPLFSIFAVVAVIVIARIYRQAPPGDWKLGAACALLIGGAIGNLLDRLRSPLGVVDFIDVGWGTLRFWVFNIADIGVSTGAIVMALLLWKRDGLEPHAPEPATSRSQPPDVSLETPAPSDEQ